MGSAPSLRGPHLSQSEDDSVVGSPTHTLTAPRGHTLASDESGLGWGVTERQAGHCKWWVLLGLKRGRGCDYSEDAIGFG